MTCPLIQQTAAPASAGTGVAVTERGDSPAQGLPVLDPSAGAAVARTRSPAWPPHRRPARPPACASPGLRVARPARRPAEAPNSPRPLGRRGHAPPAAARVAGVRTRPTTTRDAPTAPRCPARATRASPPHAPARPPPATTAPLGRPRPRMRGHAATATTTPVRDCTAPVRTPASAPDPADKWPYFARVLSRFSLAIACSHML